MITDKTRRPPILHLYLLSVVEDARQTVEKPIDERVQEGRMGA